MVPAMRLVFAAACVAAAAALEVADMKNRPVTKVINVLKDMTSQLEKEGEEDEDDNNEEAAAQSKKKLIEWRNIRENEVNEDTRNWLDSVHRHQEQKWLASLEKHQDEEEEEEEKEQEEHGKRLAALEQEVASLGAGVAAFVELKKGTRA